MEIFIPKTSKISYCSTETHETIGTLETLFITKNALKSTKKGIITSQISLIFAQKQPFLTQKTLKNDNFSLIFSHFCMKIAGFTAIKPGFCSKVKQFIRSKYCPPMQPFTN